MNKTQKKPLPPQPATHPSLTSSPQFWIKIFILVQLLLLGLEFSPDFSTNGDDAKYYLLGKSLTSGNGFHDLYDPQNPVQRQYPPLFPGFLGAIGTLADSPLAPKIVVGILSCCAMLLLFFYLRPFLGRNMLLALLLVCTLSASLASHATLLMSETFYLFAVLGALVLLEAAKRRGGTGPVFWAAVIAAVAPQFIRSVGFAFVGAWVLDAILDKQYKRAVACAAPTIGLMLLGRLLTGGHGSYFDSLFLKNSYDPELGFISGNGLFLRIAHNLHNYLLFAFPKTLLGIELKGNSAIAVSLLSLAPMVLGWIRNIRMPTRILSGYLLFYAGIVAISPEFWGGERYLIPILPFAAYFLLLGLETIAAWCSRRFMKTAAPQASTRLKTGFLWAAALAVAACNLGRHSQMIGENAHLTPDWQNFYRCADWVRLNTASEAVIVNRKPELFYLRSKRKGFVYPFSHDVDKVIDGLKKGGANYCVLDNFSWTGTTVRYLFPAIIEPPGTLSRGVCAAQPRHVRTGVCAQVTLIIFRKDILFFFSAFALWALVLFARYGDHRYFEAPLPSADFEASRGGMDKVSLLRNSISELQRNLLQEKRSGELPHILQNLGCAYYDLYKATADRSLLDSALTFINQSIIAGPGIARFHYNCGRLFTELGDQRKALEQYELTLQCDPGHILALSNAGTCSYFAFGARDASARYFARAIAIDSLMPMCHLILGLIGVDLKNYSSALADFEKELADDNAALARNRYPLTQENIRYAASLGHQNLAILYSTTFKDRAMAQKHFAGYLTYEPDPARRELAVREMQRHWGGTW